MRDFIMAALPLLLVGLALAYFTARDEKTGGKK